MAERIAAEEFGLKARTHIELLAENHYVLIIDIKNRLIMTEGRKISENAEKIRKARPGGIVNPRGTSPVCSKNRNFLLGIGVEII